MRNKLLQYDKYVPSSALEEVDDVRNRVALFQVPEMAAGRENFRARIERVDQEVDLTRTEQHIVAVAHHPDFAKTQDELMDTARWVMQDNLCLTCN